MNFTQHDVDTNHVRYVHTGSQTKSLSDFFVFQINDGEHRMPKETFEIEIINSKGKDIALLSKGLAVKEGDSRCVLSLLWEVSVMKSIIPTADNQTYCFA